jgi:hypothetical protein
MSKPGKFATAARKPGLGYEGRLHYTNRCTARRQRDGKPCGAWAVRGATVCRIHGGMSPQVQRKAKERLAASNEYVAQALSKALKDKGVKADGLGLPAPWGERLAVALEVATGNLPMPAEPPCEPAEPTPTPEPPAPTPPVDPPDLAATAPEPPEQPAYPYTWSQGGARALEPQGDATEQAARANRRAGVSQVRRKRR